MCRLDMTTSLRVCVALRVAERDVLVGLTAGENLTPLGARYVPCVQLTAIGR
jgi:hypothetical protein